MSIVPCGKIEPNTQNAIFANIIEIKEAATFIRFKSPSTQ